jgi:hypothetical protein
VPCGVPRHAPRRAERIVRACGVRPVPAARGLRAARRHAHGGSLRRRPKPAQRAPLRPAKRAAPPRVALGAYRRHGLAGGRGGVAAGGRAVPARALRAGARRRRRRDVTRHPTHATPRKGVQRE